MEVNIRPTRLYRLRDDLPPSELAICLAAGIERGKVLWLKGSRPSSLGGYIGHFSQTYTHARGTSPTGKSWQNMPMRYFVEIVA